MNKIERKVMIHFWTGTAMRSEIDKVIVEEDRVMYLLHGYPIAIRDFEGNIINICDCGWKTALTKSRLNAILSYIGFRVFSRRGEWMIEDEVNGKVYGWMGYHQIEIRTRRVSPSAVLR